MAFSVTADQARQDQVWENLQSLRLMTSQYQIRRLLTEAPSGVRTRARFVGLGSLRAGRWRSFYVICSKNDDGGWLQDVQPA